VNFSQTILYAAEVATPDTGTVHVLGYQNRVQGGSGSRSFWRRLFSPDRSGNAMILPFPARPATMTQANVIDTEACPNVLQDVAAAISYPMSLDQSTSVSLSAVVPKVQVFEAGGVYTVVLAQDPNDIPAALSQVPPRKRPALNPALFDAYARWYPGWTVALCCFSNDEARLARPLLWWYAPMHPDRLFLPALDCHTGEVPDLVASVLVDHVVAVGSYRLGGGNRVAYRDRVPEAVIPYLRPSVLGKRYYEYMHNGDFVCRVDDVTAGDFSPVRCAPVAA
jgi:hypothetical protein